MRDMDFQRAGVMFDAVRSCKPLPLRVWGFNFLRSLKLAKKAGLVWVPRVRIFSAKWRPGPSLKEIMAQEVFDKAVGSNDLGTM